MTKIIQMFVVACAAMAIWSSEASAVPMLASWTGTVEQSSGATPLVGAVAVGSTMNFEFTYDTSYLGTLTADTSYNYYSTQGVTPIYSKATISINGGPRIDVTSVLTGGGASEYSEQLRGDPTKDLKDIYDNDLSSGNTTLFAIFYDFVGGITSLNPAQTFSATNPGTWDSAFMQYSTNSTYFYGTLSQVTVSQIVTVPAPGALALLGFGLFGIGGMRRKQKAA